MSFMSPTLSITVPIVRAAGRRSWVLGSAVIETLQGFWAAGFGNLHIDINYLKLQFIPNGGTDPAALCAADPRGCQGAGGGPPYTPVRPHWLLRRCRPPQATPSRTNWRRRGPRRSAGPRRAGPGSLPRS